MVASQAQTDSVRTEYKTEDETISRSEIQRVIRYITRANVEEKTLIKFGGLPNSASLVQNSYINTIGLSTELSIERKLSPAFSVLFGFDNQILGNFYRRDNQNRFVGANPQWLTRHSISIVSSAKVAVRYYYGMTHRIKEGKSANNFSGTYVALQARRPVLQYLKISQRELWTGESRVLEENSPLGTLNSPSFALQWGVQQRLGRRGYIDLNIGPEVTIYDYERAIYFNNGSRTQLSLRFSAIIGLGW